MELKAAIMLLANPAAGLRRQAAGMLGEASPGTPEAREAALALAAHLPAEVEISVREAAFLAFTRLGGAETAAVVGVFLRSDDAALRNGAVETLKRLGDAAMDVVDRLMRDPDPDVRLLSLEAMRNWPAYNACPRLEFLLTQEEHINVCGVALDIAMATGDASLLPALNACRQRFAGQFFLEFAIDAVTAKFARLSPPADMGAIEPISMVSHETQPAKPATKARPAGRRRAKASGA